MASLGYVWYKERSRLLAGASIGIAREKGPKGSWP